MNKALYFPIFVNDFEEVQLTKLKRLFGIKGYGIFTFLRTKLQDVDNYEYPLTMVSDLSYMAGIPENEMLEVINNSGLFVVANGYFSCPLLDEALNRHNGIKEKKSEQGKKGGIARMSTLTSDERKALSQKGVQARKNKLSEEQVQQPVLISNAGYAGYMKPAIAGSQPSNEIEMEIEKETEIEKENKIERKIDIENNQIPSFSPSKLKNEVDAYLKLPSKYFYGLNQNDCSRLYERYRVEQPDIKIKSILAFEQVLYYYLLCMTNTHNVQDLNQRLSQGNLSINVADIYNTVKLITSKKEINDDYKRAVISVIGSSTNENQ